MGMRTRLGLWVLLAALLAAQILGLMHRILHAPHGTAPAAVQGNHAHRDHGHDHGDTAAGAAASDDACAPVWWASLFGEHESAADCRLYDQLTPLDLAALIPAVVLPLFLPAYWLTFFQGEALARHAALFEARAPPSLR